MPLPEHDPKQLPEKILTAIRNGKAYRSREVQARDKLVAQLSNDQLMKDISEIPAKIFNATSQGDSTFLAASFHFNKARVKNVHFACSAFFDNFNKLTNATLLENKNRSIIGNQLECALGEEYGKCLIYGRLHKE